MIEFLEGLFAQAMRIGVATIGKEATSALVQRVHDAELAKLEDAADAAADAAEALKFKKG